MKVTIVFHSVCGNDYLLAKKFQQAFTGNNHTAQLYRVRDEDWTEQADCPEPAKKVLAEMQTVAIAKPEHLLEADLIVMGSPTYFGNVSAEVKTFMDETSCYWFEAKLAGKKFMAFSSVGNPEGGGDLCLQALHTYAKYMGFCCISLPANILPGQTSNAYGVLHYSLGQYAQSLDDKTAQIIDHFVQRCV
jgi:NAD(P)H dehydrogenase (quinone)